MHRQKFALAFLALGSLSFGFAAILIKLCAYPATVIACFRILLAGLLLLPFCLSSLKGVLARLGFKGTGLLLLTGLFFGLHFQLWVMGIKKTYVASGTFIMSISPVFFAFLGGLIDRRRISAYTVMALGLVVAGAVWLFYQSRGRFGQVGDLLCFASVLIYVFYLLLSRHVSKGLPHLAYIHLIYFWGGVLMLPFAVLTGEISRFDPADLGSLLALLALVVFPTLIGHTSQNYGVRILSPLTVSFFIPLEPVFASLAAIPILSELPDAARLPSYLLFLGATLIYLLTRKVEAGMVGRGH